MNILFSIFVLLWQVFEVCWVDIVDMVGDMVMARYKNLVTVPCLWKNVQQPETWHIPKHWCVRSVTTNFRVG